MMLIGGRVKLLKVSPRIFPKLSSTTTPIEYADSNKIRMSIMRDRLTNLSDSELVSFLALTMITEADSAGQFDWVAMRKILTKPQANIVAYYSCDEVIIHEGMVRFFFERGMMLDEFRDALKTVGAADSFGVISQASALLEEPANWKSFMKLYDALSAMQDEDEPAPITEEVEGIEKRLSSQMAPYQNNYLAAKLKGDRLMAEYVRQNANQFLNVIE